VTSTADAAWPGWLRDEINARDLIQTPPILVFQIADADRNLDLAARRAADLGRLGIRLCLDGLVPGEPGERVVERLPTAFVRLGAEASRPAGLAALKSLIDLIHQRRGWVIANGVDGPESIAGLYRQSVDLIQGPYVQPPAESMDFDFSETESAG
jgi:EAL domain-containing protein (putative c-di-GMP-specific phosphodiesterase class I)